MQEKFHSGRFAITVRPSAINWVQRANSVFYNYSWAIYSAFLSLRRAFFSARSGRMCVMRLGASVTSWHTAQHQWLMMRFWTERRKKKRHLTLKRGVPAPEQKGRMQMCSWKEGRKKILIFTLVNPTLTKHCKKKKNTSDVRSQFHQGSFPGSSLTHTRLSWAQSAAEGHLDLTESRWNTHTD